MHGLNEIKSINYWASSIGKAAKAKSDAKAAKLARVRRSLNNAARK